MWILIIIILIVVFQKITDGKLNDAAKIQKFAAR